MNISKSKYLSGLQCDKLLWRLINTPKTIPPCSEGAQAIFDQGHAVGILAQKLFPKGISIPWESPFPQKLSMAQDSLQARKPIYEASFSAGGACAQVDILVPSGSGWNIVEVKSSTSVQNIYYHDLALQRYVCEAAGISINRCILAHLNAQYVRQGGLNVQRLFIMEDLTDEVSVLVNSVPERLNAMQQLLQNESEPDVSIGPHCSDPYDCILKDECWAYLPEHSIFDLYRCGKKKWKLLQDGIRELCDAGKGLVPSEIQQIQIKAVRRGSPVIDKPAIRKYLNKLVYPLWLLDFETFQSAVPLYGGTKPYQQIPFQFSLHRVDAPGAKPIHASWLAEGADDPRLGFADALLKAIGPDGSIIGYNVTFERSRLEELAAHLPALSNNLEGLSKRFIDLMTPFRGFHYYHPDQHGSCSLKEVLPALTGKSYKRLMISEGSAASRSFLRVEHGSVPDKERKATRSALEAYCEQDTLGLLWILDALIRSSSVMDRQSGDRDMI